MSYEKETGSNAARNIHPVHIGSEHEKTQEQLSTVVFHELGSK